MKSSLTYSRPSRSLLTAAAVASVLAFGVAQAQGYSGPRSEAAAASADKRGSVDRRGYSGPSSVTVTTVKELLDNGKDDQRAILRGRIVSWDGGKHYTFDDGTGQIRLEISRKYFPRDLNIDDKTTVEIYGELEKKWRGVEFEVEQLIRVIPKS